MCYMYLIYFTLFVICIVCAFLATFITKLESLYNKSGTTEAILCSFNKRLYPFREPYLTDLCIRCPMLN